MTFGEKLQALRKARGWSQEELAQQINVSRQALSKWESGASVPDTENVVALSRLFGVPTDYLLLDEMKEPGPGQGSPAVAWPKPRKYLLAAAIVGAVGAVALRFIWAAMTASMFFNFSSDAWSFMENDTGLPIGSFAPMIQHYTLLSVLNTVFLVLLAAGGLGAALYHPLLRLWKKHCTKDAPENDA